MQYRIGIPTLSLLVCLVADKTLAEEIDIPAPAEFAPIQQSIQEALAQRRTPSVAVAVVREHQLVWAAGFGNANLQQGHPATSNSLYRLASISKPLTATGLMILRDRGLIDLDAPANRYLPGPKLKSYVGPARDISIRHLANHTSGLPLHYNFFYEGPPPSVDDAIRCYGFAATKPGAHWQYSNLGYGILGYITEIVSQTPWPRFMREQVYAPLGMHRTSHHVSSQEATDVAVPYRRDVAQRYFAVEDYGFDHPGASVIWSTARDLARFAQMHLNLGELDGVRILSEESAREMQIRTSERSGGGGTGIGWFVSSVRGHRCLSHSGGMPGVSTMLRIFPDDGAATIVLTNTDNRTVTQQVTRQLAEILFPDVQPETNESPRSSDDASQISQSDAETWNGLWNGHLTHYDGPIPISLEIQDPETATIRFGQGARQTVRNLQIESTSLRGQVEGMLPTQSEFHGPVTVQFRLDRQSSRLTGVAIALAPGYFALSHWLELNQDLEK